MLYVSSVAGCSMSEEFLDAAQKINGKARKSELL